jgi:hypothetical protein
MAVRFLLTIAILQACSWGHASGREVTMPSPEDIEKLVCKFASQKQIEDKATEAICKVIKSKFPDIPDCERDVEVVWNAVLTRCPHGRNISLGWSPEEIEKLVCKFASQKQIEDRSTRAICTLIVQKFPAVKPSECEAALDRAWDAAVKRCPRGREGEDEEGTIVI